MGLPVHLDAAALIIPLVKFISPTDPKWVATMDAINEELVTDSLVYRYRVNEAFPDGLQGKDGTFTLCSFWLIECTARKGNLKRARFLFEKILSYGNELGLFSEQLDQDGKSLGNIPQAFTHLALISAAHNLDRRLDGASVLRGKTRRLPVFAEQSTRDARTRRFFPPRAEPHGER